MKGKFIVFEGIDGSGKSAQLSLLKNSLKQKGYNIITTRDPGGTRIGGALRNILLNPVFDEFDPYAEALVYAASRAQLINQAIIPAVESGKIVLCDRFIESSIAYQGYGRGIDLEYIYSINKQSTSKIQPELVFIFDIDYDTAIKRMSKRMFDRIENEPEEFFNKIRHGYLYLVSTNKYRYAVINANRSIEEVHNEVLLTIKERLGLDI